MVSTREKARGRWSEIFNFFGIESKYLTGKNGPCPHCGGTDRFRMDNRKGDGDYFCSGCGSGYGTDLIMKVTGKSFIDVVKEIDELIDEKGVEMSTDIPAKPEKDIEYIRKITVQTLKESGKSDKLSYLESRGIAGELRDICFHPALGFYKDRKVVGEFPAMIGVIRDENGAGVALHRTYMAVSGDGICTSKKLMPGVAPLNNVAIRLYDHGDTLGVAEGIETACSAKEIFDIPTWACINTKIMETFVPPRDVKHLIIFGDNDESFAGQFSAYKLAVAATRFEWVETVEVRIPASTGDWNDVLLKKVLDT